MAEVAVMLVVVALTLVWIATRPLHPPVPALYRARVRSAWEDWVGTLAREPDPAEALRATEGLALRLDATKPPRSLRGEHERRLAQVREYRDALRACETARHAGDEVALDAAIARLNAARDAFD